MMRTLYAGFAILVALLTATPTLHASTCTPSFSLQSGDKLSWQGADDAYSIPLPDGRDIWIFGDTLYGPQREVTGHAPRMTHSSLGISTCDAQGNWHVKYVLKHDEAGNAASFFVPKDPKHWYWAMDGFYAKGDLWVTLLCIRSAPKPQPWAMDFETCGSDIARVSNLKADPQQWKVDYFPLVADGTKAYPSASAVVHDGYAYIFALYESGNRPQFVTRIPLKGLDAPQKNLEYLATDGKWKPGFDPANAKPVMEHGASELSIRYHPELKKWLAVLLDPSGFTDKVIVRSAPDLAGPWTEGDVVYHIPEMQPGPKRDKDTFCYAGKEHPEFEKGGEINFTYVCNTMDVPKLVPETNIYFPQVVTVPVPDSVKK